MKQILTLFLTLAIALQLFAQEPQNRTAQTVVADALAQLPAQNENEFRSIMGSLVKSNQAGYTILADMFNSVNNEAVNYALSGLAQYLSRAGFEEEKERFIAIILDEIPQAKDVEVQKFYIRLLAVVGDAQIVDELEKLKSDKNLQETINETLFAINGDAVVESQSEIKVTFNNAKKLYKNAQSEGNVAKMVAAMELMLLVDEQKSEKLLLKSVKDDNIALRNGVLNLIRGNQNFYGELIAMLKKVDTPIKIDIIRFFGEAEYAPATEAIIEYVGSKDKELSIAAILNAAKCGSGEDLIELLCNQMITSRDVDIIDNAAFALSYVEYGDSNVKELGNELAEVVKRGGVEAQVAAIELLAARRSVDSFDVIVSKLNDSNQEVAAAAYQALEMVSQAKDIDKLAQIIVNAPENQVINVQNAILSALSEVSADNKAKVIAELLSEVKSKESRVYAVFTLMGDQEMLHKIVDKFPMASQADKSLSIEALAKWQGGAIYGVLADLIQKSNDIDRVKLWDLYLSHIRNSKNTAENRRIFATNVLLNSSNESQKQQAIDIIGNTGSFVGMITVAPFMDSSNEAVAEAACQAVRKIALGNSSYNGEEVIGILEKCMENLNNPDAGYQIEAIKKHIGELEKGDGYVAIFNGKDLKGWKGLVSNPIARAKMSKKSLASAQKKADELMRKSWSAKGGSLYFNGKGDNICTEKMYGDFEMFIDWKLYDNSSEADAGIYLRGTPQVQIWDISRTNVGAQVGSGGLYNNQKNPSKPTKLMDNELGEWNSFYIKMVGERVTVVLNGETVVDNVILENYWDRKLPIFIKEQIELQAHGSEVEYRNIYIKELEPVQPTVLSKEEQKEGFKLLFDGISMNNWVGNKVDYVAEDGAIVMYPSRGFGGNIYTDREYSNFILRFEFLLTEGANNGLGIRTPMGVDAAYHGMELQILDNTADIYANLAEYQYHGSVYGIHPAKRGFLKPVGEWNVQEVVADGNRIKVTLNGEVIVDVDIAEASKNNTETLDKQKHPGLLNKSGYIGFLGHGSHVKFKNIRIKELK